MAEIGLLFNIEMKMVDRPVFLILCADRKIKKKEKYTKVFEIKI